MKSINPYNNQLVAEYNEMSDNEVASIVDATFEAWQSWKETSFAHRSELMMKAASVLRSQKKQLSELITIEMGKRIVEAEAEIEKCAWVCEYYAEKAENMLADEPIVTDAQKAWSYFSPLVRYWP